MEKDIKDTNEQIHEDVPETADQLQTTEDSSSATDLTETTDDSIKADEAKTEDAIDFEGERPRTFKAYMPRFTEASDNYRKRGDAEIRQRLGISDIEPVEGSVHDPDEIKLDPTGEFDEDVNGTDAKEPENIAIDESDESIVKQKVAEEEPSELDIAAEKEREEIKKLLRPDPKPEPKPEPIEEEMPEETSVEEVKPEETAVVHDIPDPDKDDIGVFDFDENDIDEEEDSPEGLDEAGAISHGLRVVDREFNNPAQRDSFKDGFLDKLMSIRIRMGASVVFAIALLVLELLCATKVISFKLFDASGNYSLLGILDFLLASCVFIMAIPEIVRAAKHLCLKKLTPDLLPLPAFGVLGLYTLAVALTGSTYYSLFGLLFATLTIPTLTASLYKTKADFIAFKMISQNEEKQIIDKKNTRDAVAENIALDGIVDEYKSKLGRTFRTSFISDFFKNSSEVNASLSHIAMIFGIPFGVGIIGGAVAYFLSWNIVTAASVFALSVMLGCPAFAILSSKISFFHTQRAALTCDSTAIGEDAYHSFSAVDVFSFDDSDIFGPDDVNLKRFMLYGERDSMEKVMRQMCALFASVGGPLDYMFSNAIDNRVRHKSATNMVIEDDGICGDVAGHKICAGSEEYMRRNGIAIPAAATAPEKGVSFETIKVMYAAEDGEVYAKFYIRYSFSEEFTMILPSLRESGITPLVYTRDPNVSNDLLDTLTTGAKCIRVVKIYKPLKEETVFNRVSAGMVTYGDKLDAANMIMLSKKFEKFSLHVRFAEVSSMIVGVILAMVLSIIGFSRVTVLAAAIWQCVWCLAARLISKAVFLKDTAKKEEKE